MSKAKTLFRTHHEQARQASRRLSLIFWMGVLISALSYILVARLFLYILLCAGPLLTSSSFLFDSWIFATILGLIPIITMIIAYFDEHRHMQKTSAENLAIEIGARPLKVNGNINQQRLQNIVEEISIASGTLPPPTLIMEKDHSINAFVLGGARKSVALTISNGALTHLTRDELQALIAHEFGHIINQDVFIYSKLSSMLHGYYIVSEWRYSFSQKAISSSRLSIFVNDDDLMTNAYHLFIGFWGFILLGCGRLIQASFSREREWMADAKSVEYTRNSDALVGVLKKALALQYLQTNTPKNRESYAHFFFINYRPKTNFLKKQTHPPIKDRIKRYGGSASDNEIAALAYEMMEKQRQSPLDDVAQKHQQAFITATAYPIFLVKKHVNKAIAHTNTSKDINAEMFIYAIFIFHSGQSWFELSQSTKIEQDYLAQSKQFLMIVEKIHPLEQFFYFQQYCHSLSFTDKEQKNRFINRIKQLITMDKDFSIYEWCYYLLLKNTLKPTYSDGFHYKVLQNELNQVFSFCASVYGDNNETREHLFNHLSKHAVPLINATYKETAITTKTFLAIQKDIMALQKLKPIYKQHIIDGLESTLDTIKTQSLASVYVNNTIKSLLRESTV